MDRQNRLMLVLAAVLLAMLAAILLVDPPDGEDEGEGGEEYSRLFADRETEQIERVVITRGQEERAFVRDTDGWRIVAPVQAPADSTRVEAMVDSLVRVEAGPPLEGDAGQYGLAPPRTKVALRGEDGVEQALWVGADAPVGFHSYVQAGEGAPPRASRARLSPALDVPLDDLRQRSLWRIATTASTSLSIAGPQVALELVQREGSFWVRAALAGADGAPPVLDGPAHRADPARVDALLRALASLEAAGFRDELAPDIIVGGELVGGTTITVEAAGARQSLYIAPDPAGGADLATGPLQAGVVALDPAWRQFAEQPVTAWWDTMLLPVAPPALSGASIQLGDRTVRVDQDEAGVWSPDGASRLLDALAAARIEPGEVPSPAGAAWGELRFETDDGRSRTLRIFQQLDDGSRLVADDAGGSGFRLPAIELERIRGALP
ncbi:MAG: DUF4340 domain-containing protein [Alphaproteobacteria bacterium]|nr:DUF4340 domain-containing protein [Alphaproteobacteria bacterium]